jgi:hypothetical protein
MSFNASVNSYAVNGDQVNAPVSGGVTVVVDTAAIAAEVWSSDTGVAVTRMVEEIWARMGLDAARPLTTSTTGITFGGVEMTLTGTPTSTTLTRQ